MLTLSTDETLYHPLSLTWIENGQIPFSDYTGMPCASLNNTRKLQDASSVPGLHSIMKGVVMSSVRICDGIKMALLMLTVSRARTEIACREAKEISFPYIFHLAWSNLG